MDNFRYKKEYGQNFIKDDNIIDKIVRYSDIDKDTVVIEIGPGGGSLSKKIVPLSKYAILYEIDERLREHLSELLSGNDNYEIVFGDFLSEEISGIRDRFRGSKIQVVANLPYYITTPIITKLLREVYPNRIIVMVQKEVAQRLSSKYGSREYGMISVLLGSRYKISKLFDVSRKCFIPEPNVDSSVICLDKCDLLGDTSVDIFERLIKSAFQYKRKNLKNNLKGYDLEKIDKVLNKYNYSLSNRAEDIPVEVFIEIAKYL